MTSTPLPARLLAKEDIEILDGACQPRPRVITRHDLEHDVTALLKRGLTTTSAGGFFFIPYLLQLGVSDLVASLGPPKPEGLPHERLALGLVFESIFGYTACIRTIDTVSRADLLYPGPSVQEAAHCPGGLLRHDGVPGYPPFGRSDACHPWARLPPGRG